jgi:deoxyribodipyrimidine photolyase-like uncharacterized protein
MTGTPRRWLFADQLGPHFLDEPGQPVVLVESTAVFRRRRFHRQKAHLVLSALRRVGDDRERDRHEPVRGHGPHEHQAVRRWRAYINRMSDYCGGCRYDPAVRVGDDACPYTAGYWAFLERNE